MAFKSSQIGKFARMWGRGVMRLNNVYIMLLVLYFGYEFLSPLSGVPILYYSIGSALFIVWLAFAPLDFALEEVTFPLTHAHVASIATEVDKTAELLGLQWGETYVPEVQKLIDADNLSTARKVYRERSGRTWDEANAAIMNWPGEVIVAKLRLIQNRLQGVSKLSQ